MAKVLKIVLSVIFLLVILPRSTYAQTIPYTLEGFESQITINQDTSITVLERLTANFNEPRHGIYRTIPVLYETAGKKINSRFKLVGVTDSNGKAIPVTKSSSTKDVTLRIGDPDTFVTGEQTYVIHYTMQNIIQSFDDHEELYWNVAGSGWDTTLSNVSATVVTAYARVNKADCFTGTVGSVEKNCAIENGNTDNGSSVTIYSRQALGQGSDMTIVVALNKTNELLFPGRVQKISYFIQDNFIYALAVAPLLIISTAWYRNGKDQAFNIFESYGVKYGPIKGLTPAQVGVLIDERADLRDIISEIMELARLRFIKINKLDKKGLFKKTDYQLVSLSPPKTSLTKFQSQLLSDLFESNLPAKAGKTKVLLSELKNKFYTKLPKLKKTLYEEVSTGGYFAGNPDKVRTKWAIILGLVSAVCLGLTILLMAIHSVSPLPIFILIASSAVSAVLVWKMPKRTAKGYRSYVEAKALARNLKSGKWRHKIYEKHLFLEEMLPIAMALGVVKQFTRDMADLGIEPPSYVNGISTAALYSSINNFEKTATKAVSAPSNNSSGWSGGSGFSGGSSGGGFGGGGGGSW